MAVNSLSDHCKLHICLHIVPWKMISMSLGVSTSKILQLELVDAKFPIDGAFCFFASSRD